MKRRRFLKSAAATSAALSIPWSGYHVSGAMAKRSFRASDNPALVVIYLRGGQDQLNVFVPHGESRYYDIRPTIAIPKEKMVRLDEFWGLHPAMEPLKPFYDQGRFAAIINSGSPHSTRSHFDAQDFMEFAAPGNRTIRDGWLNRYLSATASGEAEKKGSANSKTNEPELRALAMQELLPRSLRGRFPVVAAPNNLDQLAGVLDLFEPFYRDQSAKLDGSLKRPTGLKPSAETDAILAAGQETIDSLRRLKGLLNENEQPGTGASLPQYPSGYFGDRLQKLARVIKAGVGLEVCATDINGWDHHIGEGSVDGAMNRMLTFVAQGLAAFMKDLGPHLDRTLIMLCTEFGRVCKENGNAGTDHGHGGAVWLMGGRLNGGKIYGNWTGLDEAALYKKRDLPVTTDFRAVFSEVLQHHMKFEVQKGFFPDYRSPKDELGLFA